MNRPLRRSTVAFIFITVTLDMLALGVIIPVLPKLVLEFTGGSTEQGAKIYGVFGTIWALMHFIFSPILGALSDRFGRRPVILTSNFGLGLDYVLMAMAPTLGLLFVGRAISGITASSIPAATAYIADVTAPEKRAAAFGILGAAFGIGFVLGPALGGILGGVDARLPFWVAAGLSFANAMYGIFVLPESLPKERRSPFEWKKANPVGALKLLRSHPRLPLLAMIRFMSNLAHVVLPSTFVLYTTYRYGWDEETTGLTLAAVGICSALVQAGLVGWFVKRMGEQKTLLIGLFCGILGFAIYGIAPSTPIFWLGIPLSALWGLAGPSVQSMMSKKVGPNEQGQLQGANSSLMGIAELIGPGVFTLTFAFFIQSDSKWHLPGASFLLAALFLAVSGILASRVRRT